jgi:hypothetical protein
MSWLRASQLFTGADVQNRNDHKEYGRGKKNEVKHMFLVLD